MKGSHGAKVVMMDAGSQENLAKRGVRPGVGRAIPEGLLPDSLSQEQKRQIRKCKRPDVLVIKNPRTMGDKEEVHLVEVKYCRDSDRTQQEGRAEAQHKELVSILESAGRKVQLHKVLLGVGGTVYKDTVQVLETLGLQRDEALSLLGRLSLYAVGQLYSILCIRRHMEGDARKIKGIRTGSKWKTRDPWGGCKRRRKGVG
jgi:hypothetical protein